MSGTILAIDLGKFDSVFCRYDPDARGERFRTAPTTPDDLRRELLRRPVARVVFERPVGVVPRPLGVVPRGEHGDELRVVGEIVESHRRDVSSS